MAATERWTGRLRCADWLRGYRTAWLSADLIAGVTLAAYQVPSAIGMATLARLPPEAGLYACIFSGLVFWLFCSSRHTAVSVTSAIALLLGSQLGELAGGDVARFGALASGTALLVGVLGVLAWLVRAGTVVHFISESVMVGFKIGVALVLASTQLPVLVGLPAGHGSFWSRSADFARHLPDANLSALWLGVASLAVLIAGRRWLPGKPIALVVVIAGVLVARAIDLGAHGVETLGAVPQGLPKVGLPPMDLGLLENLLPLALACFLLGAVETAAIGRMFARRHGQHLDADRELLALGASNLAAGLGGGFPVSGGMSQSLVNEGSGARTPLSGVTSAAVMLVVVLFFSGLLAALPQPVLAAIVLMSVASLVKVQALKRLWIAHRSEFLVAVVALLGVLGSGILRGVMIGVILSLILLLRRAAKPHVAILGRIPGTRRFSDVERHPDNEPIPGALLVRCESSLLYFNADAVHEVIRRRLDSTEAEIRAVILDLSSSPHVDLRGAEMLEQLREELVARGIALRLAEAHAEVRDMLRLEGLEAKLGHISRRTSLADVVEEFQREEQARGTPSDRVPEPAG